MYYNRYSFKSKSLTIFLVFSMLVVFFVSVGIFISGPYFQNFEKEQDVVDIILENYDNEVSITRNAFAYVTYTVEDEDSYIIYNEVGEYVLTRNKQSLQLDNVKQIIKEQYPSLQEAIIQISYGYDTAVYYIEYEYEILVIDYDSLEVLFYMKESI